MRHHDTASTTLLFLGMPEWILAGPHGPGIKGEHIQEWRILLTLLEREI